MQFHAFDYDATFSAHDKNFVVIPQINVFFRKTEQLGIYPKIQIHLLTHGQVGFFQIKGRCCVRLLSETAHLSQRKIVNFTARLC